MKVIHVTGFGPARENLRVVDVEPPGQPGPGEALIDVEYAPLNKHDLLAVAGALFQPPLPWVAGNEGTGIVTALGAGVTNVDIGDRVALPLLRGSWREQLVIPAEGLFALPEADPRQLGMIGSNPPSAVLMLDEFTHVAPGSHVVQNAANSGVGRSVIAVARSRGIKTINFVRNTATREELLGAGADIVLPDRPDSVATARNLTGDAPVPLAIDGVGGTSTTTLIDVLSDRVTLVAYSAESGSPAWVPALALTGKHLTVRGFFVGEWDFVTKTAPAIREVAPLVADGRLAVPVAGVFGLDEIDAALDQLDRGGKVLLAPGR